MFAAGYQIAFYFRKTSQKHVVLLKVSPAPTPPLDPISPRHQLTFPPLARSQHRQFTSSRPERPERQTPAPQAQGRKRVREDDGSAVVVKPEPGMEEDGLLDALHAPPQEEDDQMDDDQAEGEADEKPVMTVNCE